LFVPVTNGGPRAVCDAGREDEDAADVRRVLGGDVGAFAGIVQRWQGRLVNLAWRFCHDRSMAEDMAQDAFVKAFRALATFRHESAFSTWLTAIALNSYRSSLRQRPATPVRLESDSATSNQPGPLTRLLARERASAIRQMVMMLPPRYRDPIGLFYFEEMNLAETARILGLPEGTLKARLHRGKELLKRRLQAAGSLDVDYDETEN
jgi:RNA polymerase sigma-70 factor, ECF subfamily